MNDSELENELRALLPAAPSPHLAERIERQLAAPRVAAPTAGVIPASAKPRSSFAWLWNLGWAGAGAAIAVVAITVFSLAPKKSNSTADSTPSSEAPQLVALNKASPSTTKSAVATEDQAFEPTQSSRELIAVDNSDEVLETADGPVREVRYTYLERLAWAHPTTGARLEIEVPREDVYLMPVSLQ